MAWLPHELKDIVRILWTTPEEANACIFSLQLADWCSDLEGPIKVSSDCYLVDWMPSRDYTRSHKGRVNLDAEYNMRRCNE